MSDKILNFYLGGRDDDGRTLNEILEWSDAELEAVHDFIQWLFPLPERSGANPYAPILDAGTIDAFRQSEELRQRLKQSFLRMLRFYGLELDTGMVRRAANFAARSSNWLNPSNHNHLRLTRILRCIRLLGLAAEADALFYMLSDIYRANPTQITQRTYRFWADAVERQ